MGMGVRRHTSVALPPGKDPVPIVQEVGWASEPFWRGAENLASTGIRSSDRPARSQSLYRPRYTAHNKTLEAGINCLKVMALNYEISM